MSSIPDAANLLKLRERLWSGRAVVLVGAGFSRGATPVVSGTPLPPSWSGLARAMAEELYPADPQSAPSDTLRLAEEYDQTLSRDALHQFITTSIDDDAYEPGLNHRALVRLPWSDILTTNYDTLLERAALSSGRRYAVVRSPKTLPQALAPRIIKLHGSFPDSYPLIFTETDYRQYEQTHGPFVSLARTRLVEHSLVMVGFSGDDPNFLHWSGWVRDHLAVDAPPLYFVTLGLSAPKRSLLEHRGIAPIDLASAFPKEQWPDSDERHQEALGSFLVELERGRPSNPLNWPKPQTPTPSINVALLPLPKEGDDRTPQSRDLTKKSGDGEQKKDFVNGISLNDLLNSWRSQRRRYPGWTIAPLIVRDALWRDTESWHRILFGNLPSLPAPNDLLLSWELVWRLNTAFVPISGGPELQMLVQVLSRYCPVPVVSIEKLDENDNGDLDLTDADDSSPHTPRTNSEWDWSALTEAWVEVAFAILRVHRDAGDVTAFQAWREKIAALATRRPEWTAKLGYQTALQHLDHQEIQSAREIADYKEGVWPRTEDTYPLGEVWRSAILSEIGDLDVAKRAAESALRRLNNTLAQSPSLKVRSQEGWARASMKTIRRAETTFGFGEQVREDDPPVWDNIEPGLGGDPYSRLNEVEARIERPFPDTSDVPTADFDPGRYTISSSMSGQYPFSEHKHGIAYLRLREAGGVPLRAGGFSLDPNKLVRAAAWARPFVPWVSYVALIRSASKGAAGVFTRQRVAGFDAEQAETLAVVALAGAESASLALIQGNRKVASRLTGLLEILSRLAIIKSDLAVRVLEYAIRVAKNANQLSDREWYRTLGSVVRRSASALGDDELAVLVPGLLSIPLTGRELPTGGAMGMWFEPSEVIRQVPLDSEAVDRTLVSELIEVLSGQESAPGFGNNDVEIPVAQASAAARLSYLHLSGGLLSDESDRFSEVYWGLDKENGIPNLPVLYMHFALFVPPHSAGPTAEKRVKRALLSQDWGPKYDAVALPGISGAFVAPMRDATASPIGDSDDHHIDWTAEEAGFINERLAKYWDGASKRYLSERQREAEEGIFLLSSAALLREQLETIPLALADVVLTRLAVDDKVNRQLAERVLGQMSDVGFPVAIAYPALIRLGYDSESVHQKIRTALASTQSRMVEFGAEATYIWVVMHDREIITESPQPLIEELSRLVAVGHRPALASSVSVLARIVKRFPSWLNDEMAARLLAGLTTLRDLSTPPDSRDAWLSPMIPEWILDAQNERAAGAALSASLHDWYSKRGDVSPSKIVEWRDLSVNNVLPEVRREWAEFERKTAEQHKEGGVVG